MGIRGLGEWLFCIIIILLCWLRPENSFSFGRRCSLLSHYFISSGLSTVTERIKFQAQDFPFECVRNVVDNVIVSAWVVVSVCGNDLEFVWFI